MRRRNVSDGAHARVEARLDERFSNSSVSRGDRHGRFRGYEDVGARGLGPEHDETLETWRRGGLASMLLWLSSVMVRSLSDLNDEALVEVGVLPGRHVPW